MKDAEWAESKEKSYFRFFWFLFSSYGLFWLNHPNFRYIFSITRKIKIWKFIFHSIHHIVHLSWKWDQNWGGGLHILSWEKAIKSNNNNKYLTYRVMDQKEPGSVLFLIFNSTKKLLCASKVEYDNCIHAV